MEVSGETVGGSGRERKGPRVRESGGRGPGGRARQTLSAARSLEAAQPESGAVGDGVSSNGRDARKGESRYAEWLKKQAPCKLHGLKRCGVCEGEG